MTKQEATEATELDRTRRYLRPVRATIISDDPAGVHLAVYEWLPMFEEWATGPGICGESMRQGPLPEGTEVTCADCLKWQPKYERMLAPGYRPEDDDPEVLRGRIAAAIQLHQPVVGEDTTRWCGVCSQDEEQPQPVGWWVPFPCPTVLALQGKDSGL